MKKEDSMNFKKMFTMVMTTAMTVMLLSTIATAEPEWYRDCRINIIGTGVGFYLVGMTDNSAIPAWTGIKWFQFHPDYANQFLAVGLAARTIKCSVIINSDLDSGDTPFIYALYLNE